MRHTTNEAVYEGRVYSHNLVMAPIKSKTSPDFGKMSIRGSITVATDEEGINLVPVYYISVKEFTKAGKTNSTFTVLKRILDQNKVWTEVGKEEAEKVRLRPSLGLNEYYKEGNFISTRRNVGGFVNSIDHFGEKRNRFDVDMLISNIVRTEEKEGDPSHILLRGYVFDFTGAIIPMELVVRNEKGMEYFESLEVSNSSPIFTKVWGKMQSTVIKEEKIEESGWGEPSVTVTEKTSREWIVTGSARQPYEFGEEGVLTKEELTEKLQARNLHLATLKQRDEENQSQAAASANMNSDFPNIMGNKVINSAFNGFGNMGGSTTNW